MVKTKRQIIFLALAMVLFSASCGITSNVTYVPVSMEPIERTFQVEGSKDELYVKANNWMAETFISSKDVIQFTDKESGTVTGKCVLKNFQSFNALTSSWQTTGGLNAIIKIQVRDNASKITIDAQDFQEVHSSLNEGYRYTKEKAVEQINGLLDSYEAYLKNNTSNNKW